MPFEEIPVVKKSSSKAKEKLLTLTGSWASLAAEYTRLVLSKIKPVWYLLQYSKRLIVPSKLCSINCLLDVLPSIPARTEGFAAQSIIQSTGGKLLRSDEHLISPRMN